MNKNLIKEIEDIVEYFENTYDGNRNSQQAVRAMYRIKELLDQSKIDLKKINESKM
jgi:hypothetical protein